MKRLLSSVLLISLCLLGIPFTSAQATSDVSLSLEFPPDAPREGDEFPVNVLITANKEVFSGDFTFTFNPDRLEVVKVEKGTFFGGGTELVNEVNNIAGTAHYGYSLVGTATQPTGDGVLAIITLRAKRAGEASVGFQAAQFARLVTSTDGPPSSEPLTTEILEALTLFIQDGAAPNITAIAPTTGANTSASGGNTVATSGSDTTSPAPDAAPIDSETSSNFLPIVAGLVAGIVGLLILIFLILRRNKNASAKTTTTTTLTKQAPPLHARLVLYDYTDPSEKYKGAKEYPLHINNNRLGRDKVEGANIILDYSGASRLHCEIIRKAPFLYAIRDMNSRNGTFLLDIKSGKKSQLVPAEATPLENGNLIFIGEHLSFKFHVENMRGTDDDDRATRLVTDLKDIG